MIENHWLAKALAKHDITTEATYDGPDTVVRLTPSGAEALTRLCHGTATDHAEQVRQEIGDACWREGYDEGYDEGWEYAMKAIRELAQPEIPPKLPISTADLTVVDVPTGGRL